MRNIFIILSVFIIALYTLLSCSHLPKDPHTNYAKHGFSSLEFDTQGNGTMVKEFGISNFMFEKDQSLDGLFFVVYPIYKGTLTFKSPSCGIDFSVKFNRETKKFFLKDLIPYPMRCTISITSITDQIKDREHTIVEHGYVKFNSIFEEKIDPILMSYFATNYFEDRPELNKLKEYIFIGQGTRQRQEGYISINEKIIVESNSNSGLYRVSGCGIYNFVAEYNDKKFQINVRDMYSYPDPSDKDSIIYKNNLTVSDSCDFDINVIPYDLPYSKRGRFTYYIYSKDIVKLPPPKFKVKNNTLYISGEDYAVGCSINNHFYTNRSCYRKKYDVEKLYWVRTITRSGRKSMLGIKNLKVVWSE